MKLVSYVAAAAIAFAPMASIAQDNDDQVGGAPLAGGVAQGPIIVSGALPIGSTVVIAGVTFVVVAVGVAVAVASGDDDNPATTTTTTTATTTTN